MNEENKKSRSEWQKYEFRLSSDNLLSIAYVFMLLSNLTLLKHNYSFGVILVSIAKMMKDLAYFFILFLVTLLAFAFSLQSIFTYYNTEEGHKVFCDKNNISDCKPLDR